MTLREAAEAIAKKHADKHDLSAEDRADLCNDIATAVTSSDEAKVLSMEALSSVMEFIAEWGSVLPLRAKDHLAIVAGEVNEAVEALSSKPFKPVDATSLMQDVVNEARELCSRVNRNLTHTNFHNSRFTCLVAAIAKLDKATQ